MGAIKLFNSMIDKGIVFCETQKEVMLVKTLNFLAIVFLFFFIPILIVQNLLVSDFNEIALLFSVTFLGLWIFKLNQTGKSEQALIISTLVFTTLIYLTILINDHQVASPYIGLLSSFLASVFITNKKWKYFIFVYGFLTFVTTLTYQQANRPFNNVEHLIALVLIIIIFLIFRYVGIMQGAYEEEIDKKNYKIKEQSEKILKIQKQKYTHELSLKQKDLEVLVNNISTQIQLKEDLISGLQLALKSDFSEIEIINIVQGLKQQINTQKRIALSQVNISEINSGFFERLLNYAPDITKTESEIIVYIKLGLSSKEIASFRNTTVNAIDVTKSRLRKRLKLKVNKDLTVFLKHF